MKGDGSGVLLPEPLRGISSLVLGTWDAYATTLRRHSLTHPTRNTIQMFRGENLAELCLWIARDVLGKVVPETLHGLNWNLLATGVPLVIGVVSLSARCGRVAGGTAWPGSLRHSILLCRCANFWRTDTRQAQSGSRVGY